MMVMLNKTLARAVRHVLVYGQPKTGKSALCGEMAEHGFELDWFDLEGGSGVLHSRLSDAAKERVNLIRIPDTKTWPIAIETMLKVTKFPLSKVFKICDTHGKIDCPLCGKDSSAIWSEVDFKTYHPKKIMVVDSLTQLSRSSMHQITKDQDELYKPQRDDYMNQGQHLEMFLGNIQACPYNVMVISHEVAHETEDGKEKIYPVAGTRNFSRNTAKYFDDVIYMDIFNKKHRASSGTTSLNQILTGSRADVALELIKSDKVSLLPLFDGTIPKTNEAQEILKGVKT